MPLKRQLKQHPAKKIVKKAVAAEPVPAIPFPRPAQDDSFNQFTTTINFPRGGNPNGNGRIALSLFTLPRPVDEKKFVYSSLDEGQYTLKLEFPDKSERVKEIVEMQRVAREENAKKAALLAQKIDASRGDVARKMATDVIASAFGLFSAEKRAPIIAKQNGFRAFNQRLDKLVAHITQVYDKHVAKVTLNLEELPRYYKEIVCDQGLKRVPLLNERFYLYIVLALCEKIKQKQHLPFMVWCLQEFVLQLTPVWAKLAPRDIGYYTFDRKKTVIDSTLFSDFIYALIPEDQAQRLDLSPLMTESTTRLVDQSANCYALILGYFVKLKLKLRKEEQNIDALFTELQEHYVLPLANALFSNAVSLTPFHGRAHLLQLCQTVNQKIELMRGLFEQMRYDTADVAELQRYFRDACRLFEAAVEPAAAPRLGPS